MFASLRRFVDQFWNRSRTINNEPLNPISLIVIILVDIFILVNVFSGLDDISGWYLSPSQTYPCYSEWKDYKAQPKSGKDYQIIERILAKTTDKQSVLNQYKQEAQGQLGSVSRSCLQYATFQDVVNNPENRRSGKAISQKSGQISSLEEANRKVQAQYDSTLLEKIAGQPQKQSINAVSADRAKQTIENNNRTIAVLNQAIGKLKSNLLLKPESLSFLRFLKDEGQFSQVVDGYQQASFWYPSIQLAFEALFLLPLLLIALVVNNFAQRRGYGLAGLISWHLLVIFFIPLVFKIFEFLQFGVFLQFVINLISFLFGGLLFLVSYVYILILPLLAFALIKFFQEIVFNQKFQAAARVQKSRCIQCARRLRSQDDHCPHCGFYQYVECSNCHERTYKFLPYCKQCGTVQNL